jgi:hypothetical protein
MAKHPVQERLWFIELDKEFVRIRCSFRRRGKPIEKFVVQLEIAQDDGTWRPVVRYDNSHGYCHRDTIRADGSQEKTPVQGNANQTFSFAVEDLKSSWRTYLSQYQGESES